MKRNLEQIISELKEFDLDVETTEDILEQLGMREKVIDKILDSEKYVTAEKVWNDIFSYKTFGKFDNFSDYYTHNFLS